jgi:hypothetical protein
MRFGFFLFTIEQLYQNHGKASREFKRCCQLWYPHSMIHQVNCIPRGNYFFILISIEVELLICHGKLLFELSYSFSVRISVVKVTFSTMKKNPHSIISEPGNHSLCIRHSIHIILPLFLFPSKQDDCRYL